MPNPNAQAEPAASNPHALKQAVVVIHGMGEQRPMDTIKSFVEAVWATDKTIAASGLPDPSHVWSKPDMRTGSLELRRITTRESRESPPEYPAGVRTDFYELYWADLTGGSTWAQFTGWVRGLLLRWPSQVPPGMMETWITLWIASLVVVLLALIAAIPGNVWEDRVTWLAEWHWVFAGLAVPAAAVVHSFATRYFGRVVRYTKADPDNIASRAAVRERGLKLLAALHGSDYRRIVIASHSLGTILAHDLVSYFWSQRTEARTTDENSAEFSALVALEVAAAALDCDDPAPAAFAQYDKAQRDLRIALAGRPAPKVDASGRMASDTRWLISDLVTMGSPLAHADFLIAQNKDDLTRRVVERELPTSPPMREALDPKVFKLSKASKLPVAKIWEESKLISYPAGPPRTWALHHAAPFAVVRWINIFDPASHVFFGDIIGGKLGDKLGKAIVDVNLKKLRGYQSRGFTHTRYWTPDRDLKHIAALRKAVNLLDEPGLDLRCPGSE